MDIHRHALILAVVEKLREVGSWTGKTHVQKVLALVQDARNQKLPFEFVLYKHGPYSFDVADEIQQMKSYDAVKSIAQAPYGESLFLGSNAQFVKAGSNLTTAESDAIDRVCGFVGQKGVADLERLATAAWIRSRENITESKDVARRLNQLKPHVSVESAESADQELAELLSA